jgi:hypothetical protein
MRYTGYRETNRESNKGITEEIGKIKSLFSSNNRKK